MKYLFIISLIFLSFKAVAQPYSISYLKIENGLSNNYVKGITQDKKGFIWIATEDGLNRFDGKNFDVYNKSNSGLQSNELNAILADPIEDKVWIGTQRNGLCCFDYNTESISSFSAEKDSMLTNDITHLSVASDNGIWITHYHFGIDYYNQQTKKFTSYSFRNVKGLEGNFWTAIDDGNGNLYIGHHLRGMSIVSINDLAAKNYQHDPNDPFSLPDNEVRALYMDSNKNIWVGTDGGLALFNPKTEKFTVFKHSESNPSSLLSNQIFDILQMKDGSLWVCSNMGGISILNMQENAFITPDNIKFNNIGVTNNNHGLSSPNA